ncbi:helix-turn-helix domain-containing protein [Halodesulfovibrio sp.]|jgi:cytoskeleton protein RodZ|uniref:helix-turn-helix domain-containing protein n=1 Tax=Halodesulfovibrio sp. TaxID=1912772 RepID=UPI0025E37FF2|nr:helix-turn-helix domain-containing protein [Halodesulfovibrio sp.]MCT4533841.1 DUF4115 domain-containing protein [Halodesulfovibrio sp.]
MSEMLELGTLLREERERKGITLEELSERIKLAPRTLAFIESGTKSELPHAVYVKGFVKSYAMVVGLDPEELGAMVDVAYKDELEEEVAEPVIARREKSGSPVKLIAIIVLIAVLAAVGYYFMQSSTATLDSEEATVEVPVQPKPAEQEPVVQEPVEPVEQAEQPQVAEVTPVEKAAPAPKQKVKAEAKAKTTKPAAPKAAKVESKPKPVKTKTVVKKPAAPVVAPSDVVAQNAAEKTAEKKVDGPMRLLRIEATADCWIEASGEGFPRKEFLLRNGEGFTVSFPKNLSLRLGNSGGISLTLDGVPYSFNGSDGKVRTVHIAAS